METQTTTDHPPKRPKTTHHHHQTATTSTHHPNPIPIIIPNLPNELAIEILSRLPVKTLLQLKSISKPWYNLISSPDFIKTHLSKSIYDPNHARHHLIFYSRHPHFTLMQCSLHSLVHNKNPPFTDANDIDYPMKHPHKSVWLVGSVNGLVCIAIEENDVFLWNPSLRKSKKLPSLGVKLKHGCYVIYGFGYDLSNYDYKVVEIFCVFRSPNVYETEVRVYSRNSDSWRRIEGFKGGVPLNDSGKFVKGKLHWAASPGFGSSNRWSIVSLDMGNEAYGEVEQPDYGDGKFDLILGVLGGWVCVLCNCPKTRADIWVMKEYGVRESWTKLCTFSYLNDPEKYIYEAPLCLLGNGEILLVFGSVFLLYNPKDNSWRYPEINNFDACLEAEIYVESLVSPGVDAEQGRQQNE